MYRLIQNGQTLAQEETLSGLWPRVLRLCGHMTLDTFNSRGYKIACAEGRQKFYDAAPALEGVFVSGDRVKVRIDLISGKVLSVKKYDEDDPVRPEPDGAEYRRQYSLLYRRREELAPEDFIGRADLTYQMAMIAAPYHSRTGRFIENDIDDEQDAEEE